MSFDWLERESIFLSCHEKPLSKVNFSTHVAAQITTVYLIFTKVSQWSDGNLLSSPPAHIGTIAAVFLSTFIFGFLITFTNFRRRLCQFSAGIVSVYIVSVTAFTARAVKSTCLRLPVFLAFWVILLSTRCFGQTDERGLSSRALKMLSLEQLMDIEIVSVSKHVEKLNTVPSAIQVITQKDIHNSGAKTLAEALRLSSNLQVAQANASQWAISARGFNNVLANKILVLIDGRTVYTPLYAGVFWDVQNLVLEDVDHIEVISGPGGTLWGANAVNGVINIITKSSKETTGFFVEAAAGSGLPGLGSIRYGAKLSNNLSFRVYGTGFKMGNTIDTNGLDAKDRWNMAQGGFRMDWEASKKDKITLQSAIYDNRPDPDGGAPVIARGNNITARWNRTTPGKSDFQLQGYYDHTMRDFRNGFTEDLKTYDVEVQNRNEVGRRHILTYGLNVRIMDHAVTNLPLFTFVPERKTLYLYSVFLQDEIIFIPDRLHFTVGSKLEHNSYTGFEYQPNARLTYTPSVNQAVWAAVSRAVRTPSRIDRDFFLYVTPEIPLISGSPDLKSETVVALESGWRFQPSGNLSVSLAAFYNMYDKLRSAEPGGPPFGLPITFANGIKGKTYGVELSVTHQIATWWSLKSGYTYIKKDLSVKSTSKDMNQGSAESNDPAHQLIFQSNLDMSRKLQLGTMVRYISKLPKPYVSDYVGLDVRLGWTVNKVLELSLVGQNLFKKYHNEFLPSSPSPRQIERNVYGRIMCRF